MRQPFLSLGLQLVLLSNISLNNVTAVESEEKTKIVVFRLNKDCKDKFVRLDNLDTVEFTSNEWSDTESPVEANVTCRSHFMTGKPDQGICITNHDLYFKRPGVDIEFSTTQLGSEKILRRDYHQFREWCTSQQIVTVSVTSDRPLRDQDEEYRFSFRITNVSKSEIQRNYIMDSFKYCDRTYEIDSGEEINIMSQRYPPPSDLPLTCKMSVTTKASDEYEELCVTVENYKKIHECRSSLEVSGFLSRFWPETESLGCNDSTSVLRREEMCSKNKKLVFFLKRNNETDTGFSMRAVVKSKRHSKWELLSQEEAELRGLSFMKGLTYFIATIDSLAGILAAFLATMFRHRQWIWKDWVDTKNTNMACEAVHYEESFPEPPNAEIEKITEPQAY